MNKLPSLLFILLNIFLSILLIATLGHFEPAIRRIFFPSLPEAEIQTYTLGLGIFFLFQIVWFRYIPTTLSLKLKGQGIILWFITIMFFIGIYKFFISVGSSDMLQNTLSSMGFITIKSLSVVEAFVGVGISIAITFLMFPILHQKKHWTYTLYVFSCIIIFMLTIGIPKLNLYDYTHYAGPVHDILIGNPPLTSRTWYGFFPIVLLSALFRIIPFSAASLHMVITLIHALGFLLYFALFTIILEDPRWALVGTLYAVFGTHIVMLGGINEHPQGTFIRMGAWVVIACIIAFRSVLVKKFGKIMMPLPAIVTALSLFWTLDAGLYALEAYCLYLLVVNLNENITLFAKRVFQSLGALAGYSLAIFGFINLVYVIVFQRFPMWSTHYSFITGYQQSSHMLPVPDQPWLWISVIIPVITISHIVLQLKRHRSLNDRQSAVLFVALASLTYFNYFLGRSHLNGLHNVWLPIIVCAFYCIKIFLDQARKFSFFSAVASIILVGTILGFGGTLLGYESIRYLPLANPANTLRIVRGEMDDEYKWFGPTAREIEKKYGREISEGNFTLLSIWDTWYLEILHTSNRVGINCQLCYVPGENVDFQAKNILHSPSKYLFLDAQRSQYDYGARVDVVFSMIRSSYRYVETVGLLDVYRRI